MNTGEGKMKFQTWFHASVLGLSAALLIFGGCAKVQETLGLKQDPFQDMPDEIRNGVPPTTKPVPGPTAVDAKELRIDGLDFFTFKEAQRGEAKLSGRVLTAIDGEEPQLGKNFRLVIENLKDFKGATFDPATGTFAWTPEVGTVDTDFNRMMTLKVALETTKGIAKSTRRNFNVFVLRQFNDPMIEDVDTLSAVLSADPMHEGEYREFDVWVQDPDASDSSEGNPRLLVTNAQYGRDIGPFVSVLRGPYRDPKDPKRWRFRMALDLNGAELTKTYNTMVFGLMAVSQFGHLSAPQTVRVKVLTKVVAPVFSWGGFDDPPITFYADQDNSMSFTVSDPKQEGVVSAHCIDIPDGAKCECGFTSDYKRSVATCTISWHPVGSASIGQHSIRGTVTNQSPVDSDPDGESAQFNGRINVVAGSLTPTPTPAPIPGPSPVRPAKPRFKAQVSGRKEGGL